MIDLFLSEVQSLLNSYLLYRMGLPDDGSNTKVVLDDVAKREEPIESGDDTDPGGSIFLTLVNIEEETTLKNNYPVQVQGNTIINQQSTIYLNLYLLFSAHFTNYAEGTKQLSRVIEYFQFNRKIPLNIEELVEVRFNLYNVGFENLNNMWTVLGGRYLPSVIFKARVLLVQKTPPIAGPAILEIEGTENQL